MIPQEIKDKIEAYVQAQKAFASSEGLDNIRDDVEYGYSLALPTIQAQAERIKQLEEALREIANDKGVTMSEMRRHEGV